MKKLKTLVKLFIPPIALKLINKSSVNALTTDRMWSGNYINWEEVSTVASRYNAALILKKSKALL